MSNQEITGDISIDLQIVRQQLVSSHSNNMYDKAILDTLVKYKEIVEGDQWTKCNDAPPPDNVMVTVAYEFDRPGDWRIKTGYINNGEWTVFGASWVPTRWRHQPSFPKE